MTAILFAALMVPVFIAGAMCAIAMYEEKIKNGKPMEFDGVVYVAKPVKIKESDDETDH